MILEAIAEYMESLGYGTRGRDLYVFYMPDDVTEGYVWIDSIVGTRINHEMPGYRKGKAQLIMRTQDYEGGMTLMQEISSELTLERVEMTGVSIKYLRPRTDPIVFPSSKGDNLEITVVFDAAYVLN